MFNRIQNKIYRTGDLSKTMVALTFDDGPDANWTPKILDILKNKRAKATFFVLGKYVEKYPDIAKRIVNDGHVLASHTYSHANLVNKSAANVAAELERARMAIDRAAGVVPRMFRPPYGAHSPNLVEILTSRGYFTVLWSLDTEDWRGLPAATIKQRTRNAGKGDIILFHSGEGPNLKGTLEALPGIIDELRRKKLSLKTVSEMLEIPPYR